MPIHENGCHGSDKVGEHEALTSKQIPSEILGKVSKCGGYLPLAVLVLWQFYGCDPALF